MSAEATRPRERIALELYLAWHRTNPPVPWHLQTEEEKGRYYRMADTLVAEVGTWIEDYLSKDAANIYLLIEELKKRR